MEEREKRDDPKFHHFQFCMNIFNSNSIIFKLFSFMMLLFFSFTMSANAYTMNMMIIVMIMIMPRITFKVCWPPDVWLWTTSPTMMGLDGMRTAWRLTLACTSNFIQTGGHPYDGFNDRSLSMSCMCLHSALIVELLIEYFLKYSSRVLLLFQVKARHPCTADDDIISKDHGTCMG